MLVYLDLKDWIGLAKARIGHPDGARYRPLYEAMQRLTSGGEVQTALSAQHYAEIEARIRKVRQRNDIALTMAELTSYATLVSRDQLLHAEFRSALAKALGLPLARGTAPRSVGYGVGHAFGHPFRGQLKGPGSETWQPDDRVYAAMDDLEAFIGGGWRFSRRDTIADRRELLIEAFNEATEFVILRGPKPEEVEELRGFGYRPEEAAQLIERIAKREQALADSLRNDADLRRRMEDAVGATTYLFDLNPSILPTILSEFDIRPEALLALGKAGMAALLADTPVLDVEMALRHGLFKNDNYSWKVNDVYDLAALGTAVVCCDIVMTDASAAHRLKAASMDSRYSCLIPDSPEELLTILESGTR